MIEKKFTKERLKNTESLEKNIKFKKIFIEIGTNILPITFVGGKRIKNSEIYIGLDKNLENIKQAKKISDSIKDFKKHKGKIFFINADATHLPFKENFADELYFGNVFGDPSISLSDKIKFIKEAIRVLKQGGIIIIKEDNTPIDMEILKKLLNSEGFDIKKIVKPTDANWHEELNLYTVAYAKNYNLLRKYAPNAFILYAKKE